MKRTVSLLAVLALMVGGTVALSQEGATIKDVMKTCMKGGLCKKVAGGKASDAEKKKLHDLFVAMAKCKPPKGDEDSWKEKTEALVNAAKAAVDGDGKAGAALKKAADCKGCHSAHKGK